MKRALMFSLLLIACGPPPGPNYGTDPVGPGGRPGWVDGRSNRYPDMMFLIAVGHGPAQGSCDADAYAALAKIFNAQISQVQQEYQGYASKVNSMGGSMRAEAFSMTSLTNVSTDKVIKGARIAEHWEGMGAHHCLAVLERDPAAASLQAEITRLDAEIRAKIAQGDGEANVTSRFMAYSSAMEKMAEREVLNVDLRIVSGRGGVAAPFDVAALVAKFTGSQAQIKVGLKLTGGDAPRIQTCLAQGLTAKGMRIMENSSDVDVWIHGTLRFQKAGEIVDSQMVRADLNVRITDASEGKTLAAFAEDVKVGRPTLQQAQQLAVFKLCEMVSGTLVTKIRESFHR